jgi:hypothetical protein
MTRAASHLHRRFYSTFDHVQTVLSQRLVPASASAKVVPTYNATQLWASSKNKLVQQIAARNLQNKALQESRIAAAANIAREAPSDACRPAPRPSTPLLSPALKAPATSARVKDGRDAPAAAAAAAAAHARSSASAVRVKTEDAASCSSPAAMHAAAVLRRDENARPVDGISSSAAISPR